MSEVNSEIREVPVLDLERLDVYRAAVRLDELVVGVCQRAGRAHSWLRDQAERASGSVVLNFAEAMGREGADRGHAGL